MRMVRGFNVSFLKWQSGEMHKVFFWNGARLHGNTLAKNHHCICIDSWHKYWINRCVGSLHFISKFIWTVWNRLGNWARTLSNLCRLSCNKYTTTIRTYALYFISENLKILFWLTLDWHVPQFTTLILLCSVDEGDGHYV